MQLEVKTILNLVQHYPGFVYRDVRLVRGLRAPVIEVRCEPHRSVPPCCSVCGEPCPGYDHLPERSWQFIPLWGFFVSFFYVPRRVACPQDGVVVEAIPWSEGKRPVTKAMMAFLARWARHLSWSQTARMFRTSWRTVYHSVEWFVEWGLAHRTLECHRSNQNQPVGVESKPATLSGLFISVFGHGAKVFGRKAK